MRASLGIAVLVLCLGGCGGGGDTPVPSPPSPESLFEGEYFLSFLGGDHDHGSDPWGWTAWAGLTADGEGTYAYGVQANEIGGLSPPGDSGARTYSITSGLSVRFGPGGSGELRGGITDDGAVLGLAAYGDAATPVVEILLRHGSGLDPSALTGAYHYAAYGFVLPTILNETRWGSATFDGVSAGTVTWKANTEGTIPVPWVAEPFAYDVTFSGWVGLDVALGSSYSGGVLAGGELAVLAGGTAEDTPPCLWVLVAATSGATASLLDGTYFAVGLELDHSTQDPRNRSYYGTVRADGAGGLEPDLVVKEEVDPAGGYAPSWSGYTVAADGALEVTTPAGERWVGGVSPSGRFAVFAGDTSAGMDPVLFFLFK